MTSFNLVAQVPTLAPDSTTEFLLRELADWHVVVNSSVIDAWSPDHPLHVVEAVVTLHASSAAAAVVLATERSEEFDRALSIEVMETSEWDRRVLA